MTHILTPVLGHDNILSNEKASIWQQITLLAPEAKNASKREPVDVALVIDCSGSMYGRPLEYVLAASKYVLERLGADDRASIILYDDKVDVVHTLSSNHQTAVTSLKKAHQFGGMTALASALYRGIEELGSAKDGRLRRLFLLSDGQANVGDTDPVIIANRVAKAAVNGISVSTFGVGDSYNEDLMEAIAKEGHGNYYYLDNADAAPQAFAKELEGLFATTLRDVVINLKPAKGVTISKYLGLDASGPKVQVGAVPANAERVLLVQLDVDATTDKKKKLLTISLDALDQEGKALSLKEVSHVKIVEDESLLKMNPDVMAKVLEFEAAAAQLQAAYAADRGDYVGAQQIIVQAQAVVQQSIHLAPDHLKAGLMATASELEDARNMVSMDNFSSASSKSIKSRSYNTRNSRSS